MPSTTSSSVSRLLASSTVITPSLPTFCIASAIIRPISRSLFADTVPTCAISSLVDTFFERFSISLTTASTARSMPRFTSIGFIPAATALAPSRTIVWASTVAVVVPSPAASLVFDATSRAVIAARAGPGGDHLALHRLFLGGIGNDDAALGLLLFIDSTDQDTILQRSKFHGVPP